MLQNSLDVPRRTPSTDSAAPRSSTHRPKLTQSSLTPFSRAAAINAETHCLVSHDEPVDVHVGKRVAMRRKPLQRTQMALANHIGYSYRLVQNMRLGSNRVGAGVLVDSALCLCSGRILLRETREQYSLLRPPERDAQADRLRWRARHANRMPSSRCGSSIASPTWRRASTCSKVARAAADALALGRIGRRQVSRAYQPSVLSKPIGRKNILAGYNSELPKRSGYGIDVGQYCPAELRWHCVGRYLVCLAGCSRPGQRSNARVPLSEHLLLTHRVARPVRIVVTHRA